MKRFKRIAAITLALAVVFSNAALADTVVLADRPFGNQTTNGVIGQQADSNIPVGSTAGPGSVQTQPAGGTSAGISGTAGAAPGSSTQSSAPQRSSSDTGGTAMTGPGFVESGKGGVETEVNNIVVDSKIPLPEISGQTAVLMEAATGQVLFEKNGTQAMYPASTTKLMTALLAAEKLSLDGTVNFSRTATTGLESGAVTAFMTEGDTMSVKDALHALLLYSACDVANAMGEAVSGNEANFASMMNEKARALGCTNTNFRNASGLNDTDHYTCAADMARIAAAAAANETVKNVISTKEYSLPASKKRGKLAIKNTNKMLSSANAEYYAGIIGGKTGYTSKAGNTLVEIAEVSGHRLVAVVMKASGGQYDDAKKLFEYGRQLIGNTGAGITSPENQGQWVKAPGGYKYIKADGNYARSEWLDIGEDEYYFDSNCIMATGWKKFENGAWYYLNPENGAMVHDKWVSTDGKKYYYLRSNGVLATNTVINGMYRVDANGVYVEKVG